jgi:DNA repair protein RecO (recombination protein O)
VPLYRDSAIVLRTYKLGEADRIVVMVSAQHGQVRAVAKGARKPTSRFGGRLEMPTHVDIQLYEGRSELHTVSQVATIDHFRTIRDDLDRVGKAYALCEVIDQFSRGRHEDSDGHLYRMLLGALRVLAAGDSALLVPAFHLKLLAAEGLGPQVHACVECQNAEDLVAFDPMVGGVVCRDHRRGMPLSPDALGLLARVLGGGLLSALDTPASADTHQVELVAQRLMEHHLDRRLKAGAALSVH